MKNRAAFIKTGVLALGALVLTTKAAFATDPTFPTVDWAAGLQSILTNVGAVLSTSWPYIALIIALFVGVRIVMNLPRRAAK